MRHIWQVFKYEIWRNVRRRGYLFTTFGLPILVILVSFGIQWFGQQVSGGQSPTDIAGLQFDFGGIETAGYVDQSGIFSDIPTEADLEPFSDVETARAAMDAGEIDTIYVIDPNYAENGQITQLVNEVTLDNVTSQPVRKLIFSVLQQTFSSGELIRLQNPALIRTVQLERAGTATEDPTVANSEDTEFALVYGFGILFLVIIFGTSSYLMQSVIEEKENRLIEILITSMRTLDLMVGKILALGLLGLLQVAAWAAFAIAFSQFQQTVGLGSFLSGITIPLDILPLLIVYFLLGYLMFAAAFAGVGAISNSISEGPQISLVFGAPILLTFYLFPAFLNAPGGTLPTLLSMFPLTSPLAMVMRLSISPVPGWQIALSLVLLVLGVVFMFWVAGRMFRIQSLLSGKAPSIRQLPKIIFGS
jgi:ABC-2 type transport system permease protein